MTINPRDLDLVIDESIPPYEYWTTVLERIKDRRALLIDNDEATWKKLEQLQKLEEYARFCLESL